MFHFKTHFHSKSLKLWGVFIAAFAIPVIFNSCKGFEVAPMNGQVDEQDSGSLSTPLQGLKATAISENEIRLTYSLIASGNFAFSVFRDDQFIATTTNTSFNDVGLSAGTTYTYKVFAADVDTGQGYASGVVVTSTLGESNQQPQPQPEPEPQPQPLETVAMYSYNSDLSNAKVLNGATLERQKVYLFISDESQYKEVRFYCCKGISGNAQSDTSHATQMADVSSPFILSEDLSQLAGGKRELYLDAIYNNNTGDFKTVITYFNLKDGVVTQPELEPEPPMGGDGNTLSKKYSSDEQMKMDPSVVMFSGFEAPTLSQEGWSSSSYGKGSTELMRNSNFAYDGSGYLEGKISNLTSGSGTARLRYWLQNPTEQLYVRFYVYLPTNTVGPHHWVGFRANSSKTGAWQGQAGYRPPGDKAFAGRLDLNHNLELFTYTYWHEMRCHETLGDGNCYGNTFPNKNRLKLSHEKWECVEFMMKTNEVGKNDGEQAFWLNDNLGYHYKTNSPAIGKWLHTKFIEPGYKDSWGTYETYNRTEVSFPGYNFRTNSSVKFNLFDLEYYMQANTLKSDIKTHKLYYDNVVIATERIGCR